MKPQIKLISIKSKKIKEFENLIFLYENKIENFCTILLEDIKSYEAERSQNEIKVVKESNLILEKLDKDAFVILCDEKGKTYTSLEFAKIFEEKLNINKNIIFVIGGAFGVSDEVKKRANLILNLSAFVLNHHIAKAVLLEQIYRTFTIINKIPYHNA